VVHGLDVHPAPGQFVAQWLTLDQEMAHNSSLMIPRLHDIALDALITFSPFLLAVMVAATFSPLLLNGWLFSIEALQPKFSKLNPVSGIARMFSANALVELAKAIGKSILVGGVAAWVIWHNKDAVMALGTQSVTAAIPQAGHLIGASFMAIAAAMLLIVAIDVPFQLWNHNKQLKMTKEEVRQESRETEGDPMVKGRIRSLQREAARRRMMAAIPTADVVVTNPTHYAVALKYSETGMRAPVVVAKGSHLMALRIREIAQKTMCRFWKRRHWHVLCTNIPIWASRSRRLFILLLQKCWLIFISCAAMKNKAGCARRSQVNCRCRLSLIRLPPQPLHEEINHESAIDTKFHQARRVGRYGRTRADCDDSGDDGAAIAAAAADILFTFNIAISIMVLLVSMNTNRALDFAIFPTVLLITTLLRLSLNVASTRIVLLEGHTGPDAAGKVIESFGHFLVGGNYAVGIVVFAILVVINFVVITKRRAYRRGGRAFHPGCDARQADGD